MKRRILLGLGFLNLLILNQAAFATTPIYVIYNIPPASSFLFSPTSGGVACSGGNYLMGYALSGGVYDTSSTFPGGAPTSNTSGDASCSNAITWTQNNLGQCLHDSVSNLTNNSTVRTSASLTSYNQTVNYTSTGGAVYSITANVSNVCPFLNYGTNPPVTYYLVACAKDKAQPGNPGHLACCYLPSGETNVSSCSDLSAN